MVTTPETITEKERRYGIGYRPATRVGGTKKLDDDKIFIPESEEVIERRISVSTKDTAVTKKAETKTETVTITGLSVKSKLMLGMYIGIAFILSVIVAVTGIIIGNNQKAVGALENRVKTASSIVKVQQAQLDELSSESAIEKKAEENGLVDSKASGEIVLIPVGKSENYSSSTNIFDTFCDWFSGIIGG